MAIQFNTNDRVLFQSRQFNTSASRAVYLFNQLEGTVTGVTPDTVEVAADNGKNYTFSLRNNGDYVVKGQSADPKKRNILELLEEDFA